MSDSKKETYGYEIITELNDNGAAVLGYAKRGQFTLSSIDCKKQN
ncbi:MAG: hypothetical protein ACLRZ5_00290 [Ruminococcus sp.]